MEKLKNLISMLNLKEPDFSVDILDKLALSEKNQRVYMVYVLLLKIISNAARLISLWMIISRVFPGSE